MEKGAYIFINSENKIDLFIFMKTSKEQLKTALPINFSMGEILENHDTLQVIFNNGMDYLGSTNSEEVPKIIDNLNAIDLLNNDYSQLKNKGFISLTEREYNNMINFSKEDDAAVKWCEEKYPELTTEYKKIMMEQYVLFCKKHRNYGTSNVNVGTNLETDADIKLALTGLWFRINDKIQRLKNLVVLGEPDTVGEPIEDTLKDLSVYGIIGQIVQQGKCR